MRFKLSVSFDGDHAQIATFDFRPSAETVRGVIADWIRAGDFGPDEPDAAAVDWELLDEGSKIVAEGPEEAVSTR